MNLVACGDGPLPHSRWLTLNEYEAAARLYEEIRDCNDYHNVKLHRDSDWVDWIFLEMPDPRSEMHLVVALPERDGPWGPANCSGYWFSVTPNAQSNDPHWRLDRGNSVPEALRKVSTHNGRLIQP